MTDANPKERPIIFSSPMVRAILDGRKTQTRRIMKLAEFGRSDTPGYFWTFRDKRGLWNDYRLTDALVADHCPYGQPGDRLWVREAFMHEPADYCWEASVSIPCKPAETVYRADHDGDTRGAGWKPSIHMPRWASRITLEITDVHVERLNDISEQDAQAEGIEEGEWQGIPGWKSYRSGAYICTYPTTSFRTLWGSINGPGSWEANPWVWAISFRRLDHKP